MPTEYYFNDHYDTAEICKKGHVITANFNSSMHERKNYCPKCGEKTIFKCENCRGIIKGGKRINRNIYAKQIVKPKYCENCGKPYPWTLRLHTIALEYAKEYEFNEEDTKIIDENILVVGVEGKESDLAAFRISKSANKYEGALLKIKDLVMEFATSTAAKVIESQMK